MPQAAPMALAGVRARKSPQPSINFPNTGPAGQDKPQPQSLNLPNSAPPSVLAKSDSVSFSREVQESIVNPGTSNGSGFQSVTVQPGDNLEGLLKEQGYAESEIYGKSGVLARVQAENPRIKNPNLIYPDQVIKLPIKSSNGGNQGDDITSIEGTSQASNKPLAEQSEAELKETAQGARADALQNLDNLGVEIEKLPAEERTSVKKAMFYEVAADSGLYTRPTGQGTVPMSGKEIRNYFSGLGTEDRKAAEARVKDWAGENPIRSHVAMGLGAEAWSLEKMEQFADMPVASIFDNSPESRYRVSLAGIYLNSKGMIENNTLALDSSRELFGRNKEAGRELFSSL